MPDMTDILTAHQYAFIEYDDSGDAYFGCKCGDEQQEDDQHEDMGDWHAAHVAAALETAGYGKVTGEKEWGVRRVGYSAVRPHATESSARWIVDECQMQGHPEELVSRTVTAWKKEA
ncbi:hypothetical protein [Arthrobacter cryoconiti]|uniref:Uncharacterized protein n=1 Tax=Arthrobacter cryoconiti TaxID=748907 RepID=A0ABV8QWM6_9MICC|nr:hypothetical protein [Arthrobacter cryoconiti]MCC9068816.1 hypothetical protein [Arthrobacter cryoconiti]